MNNSGYNRVNAVLDEHGFGEKVRTLCQPYYCPDNNGAPGIDPAVYFKMLMIGFFENLSSERGIAGRCADSLSIRTFLGYALTEATPHHSSLTVIRKRLPESVYRAVFIHFLGALKKDKLVKGKHLGIDTTVMEANASLKSLTNRFTEEEYWTYVKRLAAAEGIDTEDSAAVRRFDRKRKNKKVSNDEWMNLHDADAKIGKTKKGSTAMIYKPEQIVDMETGAIVDAHILPGDQGDSEELAEHVLKAEETLNEALERKQGEVLVKTATSDKGYYSVEGIKKLHRAGIKTVISDPIGNRRVDKLSKEDRQVVRRAKRAVKSKYGKILLKRRGMYNERSFAHVMDQGGFRRATLRGTENLQKKQYVLTGTFNLSLLLRKKFGVGTPKQWVATGLYIYQSINKLLRRFIFWSILVFKKVYMVEEKDVYKRSACECVFALAA